MELAKQWRGQINISTRGNQSERRPEATPSVCRVGTRGLNMPTLPLHSDVRVYDPSADSTIPSTSKKRKFEEVEEEEEEQPATPATKVKKPKKEAAAAVEGGLNMV